MRPDEHASAKTSDLLTRLIEFVDWIRFCTEAPRFGPWRASVGGPYGLAVDVNGHTVGAAPRAALRLLRPISKDAIRVRAAIDGLDFVGLSRASARLGVKARGLQRGEDSDERDHRTFHKT